MTGKRFSSTEGDEGGALKDLNKLKWGKNRKPVFGVGINDYLGAVSWTIGGKRYKCPFYVRWVSMLSRCYSEKYSLVLPTYEGCEVHEDWHKFSSFREWMACQEWEGKELDKDLLEPGNKIYSERTCVFISKEVNGFLNDKARVRGELPLGVSRHKIPSLFIAQCSNPNTGKSEHLGVFSSPEEAHLAWKERKHEWSCFYAEQQTDPRVAEALRTRYL